MRVVITVAILLLSRFCLAQSFDKQKLDDYFTALETNNKFMGSVAVLKNGQFVYTRSVGYSDMAKHLKANENSRYRIGSISKTFTAVLVFKAIELNKIKLTQTIDKYFPSIENAEKITIGQLLNHRSGIYNFTSSKDYLKWHTEAKTESQLVEIIAMGGSVFEPNSKAEYSNSNYVLLSFILEKCFRKKYSDILNDFIVKPLDLKNTGMGQKINSADNVCASYRFVGDWQLEPETDVSVPMGAGGIVSTPSDLVKFGQALFGGKLLKNENLMSMKAINDGYGMGLFQIPFYDFKGYGHNGAIDGFYSVLYWFAEDDVTFALISNGSNMNNNDISIAVLSAMYNKPYELQQFKNVQVPLAELEKYAGIYASTQVPLKITISIKGTNLIAQATGQQAFPLEAIDINKFQFVQAGVVMEFDELQHSMLLKQGGGEFVFKKE